MRKNCRSNAEFTVFPVHVVYHLLYSGERRLMGKAMRNPVSLIIVLMLSLAFLSACGQKGPLFLPGNPSSLQSIPTAEELQQKAEDEDDEDDDDDENEQVQ